MIKLSIGQIHHELSLFSANSLSIYCQNLEFSLNPISVLQIRYLFRENTINSLFFSRLHFEIIVCFTIILWNHCLFREFTDFLANSLWIYLVFRDSQWIYLVFCDSLWINHLLAKLLSIHYLFREFTINSLSISRI